MKEKESAGILLVAKDTGRVLLLKRGESGDHAGEWCLPGGHGDGEETPIETALRETREEIGNFPDGKRELWARQIWFKDEEPPVPLRALLIDGVPPLPFSRVLGGGKSVDFTTFIQYVPEEFTPTISDEHTGAGWFDLNDLPEPLHPGCLIALRRFGMNELGIAQAMAAGELVSPWTYENVTLFEMRITATGQAARPAKTDKDGKIIIGEEHVWRPPEEYLTDEFLARCNGLPVIWKHPEKSMLNSKEFADRIIGTVFFPFIRGDEVWCIAKIYERGAIDMMATKQLSTSPGVTDVGNNVANLEDGSHVLVEEKPGNVDHLAVCALGVWDKEDGPTGVVSANIGESTMTDKAETTAGGEGADARKDSALTAQAEKPDPVLQKLDSAMGILDSVAKRMDAMEAEQAKERADKKAKKDAKKARKDRMDALRGRCDSGEASEEERAELKKLEGETMADKKKDSAAEAEEAHEKEGKALEEVKDKDKKDSASVSLEEFNSVKTQLEDLKRRADAAEPTREDIDAMTAVQARFDSVAVLFGEQAPRPLAGEVLLSYRKRLAKQYQKHDSAWSKTNLSVLEPSAFEIAEKQILLAAEKAGRNPTDLAPNMLRMVVKTDPDTGLKTREFIGDPDACWGRFKSNTRLVAGGEGGFKTRARGN